jgi:hypothetical protein
MTHTQIPQRGAQASTAGRAATPDHNAALVALIGQLRAQLETAQGDNARLRRALAHAHGENRMLAAALTPRPTPGDPRSHIRTMLRDSCSINP